MSHVRCITDTHGDAKGASWCGKAADHFEWRFMDIDHAAINGRNGGYLTVCPRCRAAVIAGLKTKVWRWVMSNNIDFKRMCVEMRTQLDRVSADRDAALADLASASSDKEAYAQNAIDLRKRVDALQQRLTAADERADVLKVALHKIKARLDAYAEADMRMPESSVEVCQMIADAALKPAEGGGDA